MDKGPDLYSHIDKKTKDLLDLLYDYHNNLEFSPHVPTGYAFTSAYKNGNFKSTLSKPFKVMDRNLTAKVKLKLGEAPNILTTFIVDQHDLVPGLKSIISFNVLMPHMMGLRYLKDKAKINVSITGLTTTPGLKFSGSLRDKTTSLGTNVSFNTRRGFTACAFINFRYKDLTASLNLNNKGNNMKASYNHKICSTLSKNMNIIQRALVSLSITAVGAEATHKFSTNENIITIVTQFALSPATTLKARINNIGRASAVMQTKWNRNSFVTISGGVDTETEDTTPKFGVSFSTKS